MTRPLQMIRVALMAGALLAPGLAQTTDPNAPGSPAMTPTTPTTTPHTDIDDRGDDFNLGWLGLVGLAGLLGLRRHNRRYDEPRNIDNTGPGAIR